MNPPTNQNQNGTGIQGSNSAVPLNPQNPPVPPSASPAIPTQPDASQLPSFVAPGGSQIDPYTFGQVLDTMNGKMKQNDALFNNRNAVINAIYSSTGVDPNTFNALDPQVQNLIKTGSRPEQEMYLRMVNDSIAGHNNSLDTSVKFLADQYQSTIDNANKQKEDALTAITKVGNTPDGINALKSLYPQYANFFDNLSSSESNIDTNAPGTGATSVMTSLGITDPSASLSNVVQQYGTNAMIDAIIKNEGSSPAGVLNNPGNIKYTGLPGQTDSGVQSTDGDNFASYDSPDAGRAAISNLITNAAAGNSTAYGSSPTLTSFMNTYTNTFGTAPVSGNDIIGATGLSYNAFQTMTGNPPARLTAVQKQAIANEIQNFTAKNNVDVSVLPAEYKAYTDTLTKNIARANQTKIQADEVISTADSLIQTIGDNNVGNFKAKNILDVMLGKEVNQPWAQQYGTQIDLMANDLAGYLSAARGATSPELQDKKDAAEIVANGMSARSVDAFQKAIQANSDKVHKVVDGAVDDAHKAIWDLFGVGDKYDANQKAQASAGAAKGSQSDKAFVESALDKQGLDYNKVIAQYTPQLKSGEKLALDNGTGAIVAASKSDLDSGKYTIL